MAERADLGLETRGLRPGTGLGSRLGLSLRRGLRLMSLSPGLPGWSEGRPALRSRRWDNRSWT